jgi:hypothetical protein
LQKSVKQVLKLSSAKRGGPKNRYLALVKHKNVLLGLVAAALLTGCNAARVVAPLDAGEWRVGGALGGPQINTGRLPLISVYTAHGATEKRTDYVGLQVVSAAFQTLHLDAGSLRRIGAGGGMGASDSDDAPAPARAPSSGGGGADEILKRLLQKREQEMKNEK